MSTSLTLESVIVTEGQEERIPGSTNDFTLTLEGYRLFPIDEMIEISRHKESGHIGFGVIKELSWSNQESTLHFRLISLQSVN